MAVLPTDEWLMNVKKPPMELCEKLVPYFKEKEATSREIFLHLTRHGMCRSANGLQQVVQEMKTKRIWEKATEIYKVLIKKWNGPDIPIFIFPADWRNGRLQREFNGKGGLSYRDKLFLFLLPHHTKKEMEALIIHEYNHVCRLRRMAKKEEDYTLLDAIVLEGLSENAVRKYVGPSYNAKWTNYYSAKQLAEFWQKYILPYQSIHVTHPLYDRLLYGLNFYPKMLGYAVGYDLVNRCLQKRDVTFAKLMSLTSEQIAKLADRDVS
ncbi:uncharacterized protein YjaZ [Anoxybacillus vitaminiphilus]|uniref:Uncharacterized protein YjaZ n=1 Tax=Paranoxybacillus vitaminiphilus TaxID=581036 RepID=A0A327Y886_9BACL|nr:DUF2268 domain-containing protein [Anoxybacillus vitaminiphilus]RAK17034.1 uncharacterized protein YjaZ [Anoxybacillus vitaminiphilus]